MMKSLPFAILASLVYGADIPLDVSRLELTYAKAEQSRYKDSAAIKLVGSDAPGDADSTAVIKGTHFHNGTIDLDVAGAPAKAAGSGRARLHRSELPHPGRRNALGESLHPAHQRPRRRSASPESCDSVHLPSHWPWERLRKDTPGMYESYADMVPGEWTHMRIVVQRDRCIAVCRRSRAALFAGARFKAGRRREARVGYGSAPEQKDIFATFRSPPSSLSLQNRDQPESVSVRSLQAATAFEFPPDSEPDSPQQPEKTTGSRHFGVIGKVRIRR